MNGAESWSTAACAAGRDALLRNPGIHRRRTTSRALDRAPRTRRALGLCRGAGVPVGVAERTVAMTSWPGSRRRAMRGLADRAPCQQIGGWMKSLHNARGGHLFYRQHPRPTRRTLPPGRSTPRSPRTTAGLARAASLAGRGPANAGLALSAGTRRWRRRRRAPCGGISPHARSSAVRPLVGRGRHRRPATSAGARRTRQRAEPDRRGRRHLGRGGRRAYCCCSPRSGGYLEDEMTYVYLIAAQTADC